MRVYVSDNCLHSRLLWWFPRAPDFEKRGVKLIGISANGLSDHEKWVEDINEWGAKYGPTNVQFPIVRVVGTLCHIYAWRITPQDQIDCTPFRSPMRTGKSLRSTTCLTSRMRPTVTRRAYLSL